MVRVDRLMVFIFAGAATTGFAGQLLAVGQIRSKVVLHPAVPASLQADAVPGAMQLLKPYVPPVEAERVLEEVLKHARPNAFEAVFTEMLHSLKIGEIKLWNEELEREVEFLVEQGHEADVPSD